MILIRKSNFFQHYPVLYKKDAAYFQWCNWIFKIYLGESEASDSTIKANKRTNIYHLKKKAVKCDDVIDCPNYIEVLNTKDFTFFSFCIVQYHIKSTILALYELGGSHSNKYYDYSLAQHYAVM